MSFLTELRILPASDADGMDQFDAARTLADAYAKDVGLPICEPYRDLALARIRQPDHPPYPFRQGWSGFWPHLEDAPGYEKTWAADDSLRRSNEEMTREINTRKAAEIMAWEQEGARIGRERRDAELAALTTNLRQRYLATPGGTEATFQAALPDLLEQERRRQVSQHQTADDEALALTRRRYRL